MGERPGGCDVDGCEVDGGGDEALVATFAPRPMIPQPEAVTITSTLATGSTPPASRVRIIAQTLETSSGSRPHLVPVAGTRPEIASTATLALRAALRNRARRCPARRIQTHPAALAPIERDGSRVRRVVDNVAELVR